MEKIEPVKYFLIKTEDNNEKTYINKLNKGIKLMLKRTIQFTALTISLGIFSNLSELQSFPEKFCDEVKTGCDEAVMTNGWVGDDAEKADKFCEATHKTCIDLKSVKK